MVSEILTFTQRPEALGFELNAPLSISICMCVCVKAEIQLYSVCLFFLFYIAIYASYVTFVKYN